MSEVVSKCSWLKNLNVHFPPNCQVFVLILTVSSTSPWDKRELMHLAAEQDGWNGYITKGHYTVDSRQCHTGTSLLKPACRTRKSLLLPSNLKWVGYYIPLHQKKTSAWLKPGAEVQAENHSPSAETWTIKLDESSRGRRNLQIMKSVGKRLQPDCHDFRGVKAPKLSEVKK